jgi:hypothetical protein
MVQRDETKTQTAGAVVVGVSHHCVSPSCLTLFSPQVLFIIPLYKYGKSVKPTDEYGVGILP